MKDILAFFDLNFTDFYAIIICSIAFYLYSVVISKLVFKPFLKLYEAREAATSGAESSAQDQIDEAEELEAKYEEELTVARVDLMKAKLEKLNQASKQSSNILSEAENNAVTKITEARKAGESQREKIRKDLEADVEQISNDIVARLKTPVEIRQ